MKVRRHIKVPMVMKLIVKHHGVASIRDFGDSVCFNLASMTHRKAQKL